MASLPSAPIRTRAVLELLGQRYPGTARELCELQFETPFQLLVATVLSAQCTDRQVNAATGPLFAAYPDAESMAAAPRMALERLVYPTGFYRSKAGHLMGLSAALCDRFGGEVPRSREDLVTLPGVGRKTANVVRSVAFDLPGLPVDTHVLRLVRRLDLVRSGDPVVVERRLGAMVEESLWGVASLRLILHGRETCGARQPRCDGCPLVALCPTGRRALPVT